MLHQSQPGMFVCDSPDPQALGSAAGLPVFAVFDPTTSAADTCALVRCSGLRVVHAPTLTDMTALLQQGRIDGIIVNASSHLEHAFDLLRWIRGQRQYAYVAVIILSDGVTLTSAHRAIVNRQRARVVTSPLSDRTAVVEQLSTIGAID